MDLSPNKNLGQVWTPDEIAARMVHQAAGLINSPVDLMVDPGCGPATFERAAMEANIKPNKIIGFDIDQRFTKYTNNLIKKWGVKGTIYNDDYLTFTEIEGKADLVIMNPPYIRQENIPLTKKNVYHQYLNKRLDTILDRRSNLFALFLVKGLLDLRPGGILCAIVYDAICQTRYGKKIMSLISQIGEPLYSETVQTPFNGVMIDANILLYRKHLHECPTDINIEKNERVDGQATLGDLLNVRRGLGLGSRKAFIANPEDSYYLEAPLFFARQQNLRGLIVPSKQLSRAYIFEKDELIHEGLRQLIKERLKESGIQRNKLTHNPITGSILFNYYVRDNPRHLYNPFGLIVSDNFYAINPLDGFPAEAAWLLLNSSHYLLSILSAGRTQGSGLRKVQLFEYKSALVPDWRLLPRNSIKRLQKIAIGLIEKNPDATIIKQQADKLLQGLF